MTELTKLTLAQAREGLRKKEFSATELTQAFLQAIDGANPALNAYVLATPEMALAQAKESDKRLQEGQGAGARRPAARQQGPVLHAGSAHDRVLEDPRRLQASLRVRPSAPICGTPAPSCSASSTATSSPWAPPTRRARSGRWSRRGGARARTGTSRRISWCRAAPPAARPPPLPRTCASPPPPPTPAARSASRRR